MAVVRPFLLPAFLLHELANERTPACDPKNGIRVRPEHIHTALRELAGIADHALSRRFPLGVADKERLHGLGG